MATSTPELIPSYLEGTLTPTQITNINVAIASIYENLPPRPAIAQTTLDTMSKLGDRREKEAKATVKVLKASPNILLPPLTPTAIDNTLTLNDQTYLIQLDVEGLAQYIKMLVDLSGAQGTNWAVFAKHTIDFLSKGNNAEAKVIIEKLTKALKDVEQEMAAGKLSKSDKALLKEAKEAKAQKAAENK